jgi:hypothetical protein
MLSTWITVSPLALRKKDHSHQFMAKLTSQLSDVLTSLGELLQRLACLQRDKRVQLLIVGSEVRVGDSRDVVGVDGFGPRLELLDRLCWVVFSDCGGRFGWVGDRRCLGSWFGRGLGSGSGGHVGVGDVGRFACALDGWHFGGVGLFDCLW